MFVCVCEIYQSLKLLGAALAEQSGMFQRGSSLYASYVQTAQDKSQLQTVFEELRHANYLDVEDTVG